MLPVHLGRSLARCSREPHRRLRDLQFIFFGNRGGRVLLSADRFVRLAATTQTSTLPATVMVPDGLLRLARATACRSRILISSISPSIDAIRLSRRPTCGSSQGDLSHEPEPPPLHHQSPRGQQRTLSRTGSRPWPLPLRRALFTLAAVTSAPHISEDIGSELMQNK